MSDEERVKAEREDGMDDEEQGREEDRPENREDEERDGSQAPEDGDDLMSRLLAGGRMEGASPEESASAEAEENGDRETNGHGEQEPVEPPTDRESAPETPPSGPPAASAEDAEAPADDVDETVPAFSAPASPPPEDRFTMDRLDQAGAAKLGIVGGKEVGKSYLFQAMIYRTQSGIQSGALASFLEKDATQLYSADSGEAELRTRNISAFVDNYRRWNRLGPTNEAYPEWYRLRLNFRTGLFGRQRSALDVEFVDAAGEVLAQQRLSGEGHPVWRNFVDARVMVFCLPLWVPFPASGLRTEDREKRQRILKNFEAVAGHFVEGRDRRGKTHPVRSILALTMADDRRCALTTLRDRWITPYMERPIEVLRTLRSGAGVSRYLDNARQVSDALHEEFENARDPEVSRIPARLDFHGGRPWLVPVSAIDGSRLELFERNERAGREGLPSPVPVHVELPLLVALCERANALM